jgi:small subunit ribosomal protein S4
VARYTGPAIKQSRREGFALTDKAQKYLDRRPYPPGEHGRGRIRQSEYLLQLREKQKTRRFYGKLEKQFRRTYE